MFTLALRPPPSAEASCLQRSLHDLAEAAQAIDTRTFEVAAPPRVRAEMVPSLQRALEVAIGTLGEVLEHYDTPPSDDSLGDAGDSGVFHMTLDDIVEDQPTNPRQRVADLAFMARWELVRKREAILAALAQDDGWRLIEECCSTRRRIIKAASGVERVIAELEVQPSLFANLYLNEQQRAVQTRTAYHVFLVGVRAASSQWAQRDLHRCMRLIGTGIAQLIGRPIYEELRIEDRRMIRAVQARLVDWLRGQHDELEGRRLVSEIESAAELLMGVNRRPALIEHDCELLEKLIAAVQQPATHKASFYVRLMALRGRDPALDRHIERHCDLVPEHWLGLATSLLEQLRTQMGGARVGEESSDLHAA
jgi:hypothetical protein